VLVIAPAPPFTREKSANKKNKKIVGVMNRKLMQNLEVSKIIPIFAPKRTNNNIGLCQKYSDFMVSPSSFTVGSMSRHTYMWKGMVVWPKFDWDGKEFVQVEKAGIKANDFKKIKRMAGDR
jgi:hypothetical protein